MFGAARMHVWGAGIQCTMGRSSNSVANKGGRARRDVQGGAWPVLGLLSLTVILLCLVLGLVLTSVHSDSQSGGGKFDSYSLMHKA